LADVSVKEIPMKMRIGMRWLAVLTLWAGANEAIAAPPPTVVEVLGFKPLQSGVNVTTPTAAELSACRVEAVRPVKLASGKSTSGWILRDGKGAMLRRFVDSDGDGKVDVYSYFLNGEEAYREADSNFNEKIDQFRWMGANGSKWGMSLKEDGKITYWKNISPEEVSQEMLAAVVTKDLARLQTLMISKEELDALELPESELNRIKAVRERAPEKFQKTTAALLKIGEQTRWVHLETSAPQCIPADSLGSKYDLVRHRSGTIMYNDGKEHNWLQTGEMIRIGHSWRIVDSPVPGSNVAVANGGSEAGIVGVPKEAEALVKKLQDLDGAAPKGTAAPKELIAYNMARAGLLQEIGAVIKGADRETWLKQVADSLSAAAQSGEGHKPAADQLKAASKQLATDSPGSGLAAYFAYRDMQSEYSIRLNGTKAEEAAKIQDEWRTRLTAFVRDYPTAEDTPDALMQLGMAHEFGGRDKEAIATYKTVADNFKSSPLAARAAGAVRRLGLDGQSLELVGPTVGGEEFNIASLKGKMVIVYYWSGQNDQCKRDFTLLKGILAGYAPKGVELLTINLDNSPAEAIKFLNETRITGTHLHQPGGIDCPLAVGFGITVVPNAFLVGIDGKVLNRAAQVSMMEDEIRKALPK